METNFFSGVSDDIQQAVMIATAENVLAASQNQQTKQESKFLKIAPWVLLVIFLIAIIYMGVKKSK